MRSLSPKSVALLLLLGILSCQNGDEGGAPASSNPLWVNIDTQNLQLAVSTTAIDAAGTLYCGDACPAGDVGFGYCPPINRALPAPAIDVTWINRANGVAGSAAHGISGSCSCLLSYCFTSYSHRWSAYGAIPIAMGDNLIEVTASDASANSAKDSVTVTRVPVPSLRHPNGIAVDAQNDEIVVASSGNSAIVVYAHSESGFAARKRVISGASTGLGSPISIAVDAVNDEIIAVGANSLLTVYPRTADGDAPPLRSIPDLNNPTGVAVDAVHDEIFVARGDSSIAVFARTASGAVAPIRSITGLGGTGRIALDMANGELLVVCSDNSVRVYPLGASGAATPLRTISGASTGLNWPRDIAVDAVNGEIFVVNSNSSITVYAAAASGDAAPTRTLMGASTRLSTGQGTGIAVDTTSDEIFTANGWDSDYWAGVSSYFTAYITVYPRTGSGDAAPVRTIEGAYP
jgi:DNA-binding beta-propeller fold protein YncE